jgi:hypothetical protein
MKDFTLSLYAKAIVASLATAINFIAGLASDGVWSAEDTGNLILWLGSTFGVWAVPNKRVTQIDT